jgi:hypothetical protein
VKYFGGKKKTWNLIKLSKKIIRCYPVSSKNSPFWLNYCKTEKKIIDATQKTKMCKVFTEK